MTKKRKYTSVIWRMLRTLPCPLCRHATYPPTSAERHRGRLERNGSWPPVRSTDPNVRYLGRDAPGSRARQSSADMGLEAWCPSSTTSPSAPARPARPPTRSAQPSSSRSASTLRDTATATGTSSTPSPGQSAPPTHRSFPSSDADPARYPRRSLPSHKCRPHPRPSQSEEATPWAIAMHRPKPVRTAAISRSTTCCTSLAIHS